ncbi:extracellular solute-binding protein [Metabacillus fastidiosus]|uniref:extracellular solute-binding protein n=1 Tax=Metabacillus fastidiosus TaxID=1458 RepID=UPI003D265434
MYNKKFMKEAPKTMDEVYSFAKWFIKDGKYGFLAVLDNYYFAHGFIGGMSGYVFKENDGVLDRDDVGLNNDGAGHLRIFLQIIMPLAKPIIAVVALFSFIAPFADFNIVNILLRSEKNFTLAVGLYNMVAKQFGAEFTKFVTGSVLITIPIAILFLLFQRYFVSGLTVGVQKDKFPI